MSKHLRQLLEGQSQPDSVFSQKARILLTQAEYSGGVQSVRAHGKVVWHLKDAETLRKVITTKHPGFFGTYAAATPRSQGLLNARDTKRAKLEGFLLHLKRGPVPHPALAHLPPPDAALCHCHAIRSDFPPPSLPEGLHVMTLENLDCFLSSHRLPFKDVHLYLFVGSGGKLPAIFLRWLAAQPIQQVTHFGDYDPTGLAEFLRLKKACGSRARLAILDDLDTQMRSFGNKKLMDKPSTSRTYLRLPRGADPDVDRVLDLLRLHGPMEQEAVFLSEPEASGSH